MNKNLITLFICAIVLFGVSSFYFGFVTTGTVIYYVMLAFVLYQILALMGRSIRNMKGGNG